MMKWNSSFFFSLFSELDTKLKIVEKRRKSNIRTNWKNNEKKKIRLKEFNIMLYKRASSHPSSQPDIQDARSLEKNIIVFLVYCCCCCKKVILHTFYLVLLSLLYVGTYVCMFLNSPAKADEEHVHVYLLYLGKIASRFCSFYCF